MVLWLVIWLVIWLELRLVLRLVLLLVLLLRPVQMDVRPRMPRPFQPLNCDLVRERPGRAGVS